METLAPFNCVHDLHLIHDSWWHQHVNYRIACITAIFDRFFDVDLGSECIAIGRGARAEGEENTEENGENITRSIGVGMMCNSPTDSPRSIPLARSSTQIQLN